MCLLTSHASRVFALKGKLKIWLIDVSSNMKTQRTVGYNIIVFIELPFHIKGEVGGVVRIESIIAVICDECTVPPFV